MVPALPTADLVMVQADLAVTLLEQLLNPVPFSMREDHLGQGDLGRRVGKRVPGLRLRLRAANHYHPLDRPDVPLLVEGLHARSLCRLDDQRAFLAGADFQSV